VEKLIDNHHYSPKGFSLVKQGTPTNNTEQDPSGFTKNDPFNNISYFIETGNPLFEEMTDCDGRDLAEGLGISYASLQYIQNSDNGDHREAVAMNTALYPATLGYYFGTMMSPVLDKADQAQVKEFFLEHVTGRGPFPAIRVGNQPYGILLTSDFSNWKWSRREPTWSPGFLTTLYNVLKHYHGIWEGLQDQLMFAGKPGIDPGEALMNILGLQPGSVSFFQRIGYSTDYLRNLADFKGAGKYYDDIQQNFTSKNELLSLFNQLGWQITGIPQVLRLIYQHYHSPLDANNLIEKAPLSEKELIQFFDPNLEKNYLHWLAEANSVTTLEQQNFGEGIQAPHSLLYMQLRRALLQIMAQASVDFFENNQIKVDQVMAPVNFHNIRPGGNLTKWEVMKAKVANAIPDHPNKEMAVAEYLLTAGKTESVSAYLNRMKEAISLLSGMATARLERCFTEHIDTCSYRLDAWQSGLFHQRLLKQRQVKDNDGQRERKMGVYLGAYGWVENVRPAVKTIVTGNIPEQLKPPDNKSLFEYADNGGFVHAPSGNHAVAAAVLRSGYLTHATPDNPDVFAVNLSSERVRGAMELLQGFNNEQRIEALLGYQFERGLHDRGSQNDDLKILNEYIYKFRDKFKIEQHQIPQQGMPTATTETIPANNVVNGLLLAESKDPFPYGTGIDLSSFPAEKQNALRNAITSEKDRLEDTLDAVKDLLLSESVYQMTQGNFDRAAAITDALRNTSILPEDIEVVKTPQTSHLTFTNRVTIQFDPTPAATTETSFRARMEPGLNKWLSQIVGDMDQLVCRIYHKDAGAVEEMEEVGMDKLLIKPIDLIYIAGGELNTGVGAKSALSELESRLAFHYRVLKGLDDDVLVSISFSESTPGKKALGTLLPLLKMLKSIITDSHTLNASHFDASPKPILVEPANPRRYNIDGLKGRVEKALGDFRDCLNDMRDNVFITITVGGTDTNVSLASLFDDLAENNKVLDQVTFSFDNSNANRLQKVLVNISGFGLSDSFPQAVNLLSDARKKLLLEQSISVHQRMAAIVKRVQGLLTEVTTLPPGKIDSKIAKLIEAGKSLYGDVFNVIPTFRYNNGSDIQQSNADRDRLLKYGVEELKMKFAAEEWLQKVSHVKPRISRLDYVRTLYELYNMDQLSLKPVQLPYRSNDNWLAIEFPAKNADDTIFDIADNTVSIVIHGEPAFQVTDEQCGLLIDDWVEVIPGKDAITGLSFNYNQPNAVAPQALLLAVTPEETGNWDWEKLTGIINDTLLRAKLRAVEPKLLDTLNKPELGVLLPAVLANFSQYDMDISLDYRLNAAFYQEKIPVTAVTLN
jgi:hypothetical protein